jgi:hypothetical protein
MLKNQGLDVGQNRRAKPSGNNRRATTVGQQPSGWGRFARHHEKRQRRAKRTGSERFF